MARYERAVLGALSDSETAINRYAAAGRTRAERDDVRAAAAEAVNLARQRYLAGEDDLTALLQAQTSFTTADRLNIQALTAELQQLTSSTRHWAAAGNMPKAPTLGSSS